MAADLEGGHPAGGWVIVSRRVACCLKGEMRAVLFESTTATERAGAITGQQRVCPSGGGGGGLARTLRDVVEVGE
eukprot:CAMPEP_0119177714 /NCGR_PEP_ID=MMETSP1315-20130426/49556_1 /TAXON_ID=676789 /ORGANISM="Prasinoderma singularis, Strain RCC927" /LENGTH=74 /DNA_ID=CAMNT_0007171875 /DNA_START=46 /DNA_END=268 /DNA_ORIENTATION=-